MERLEPAVAVVHLAAVEVVEPVVQLEHQVLVEQAELADHRDQVVVAVRLAHQERLVQEQFLAVQ